MAKTATVAIDTDNLIRGVVSANFDVRVFNADLALGTAVLSRLLMAATVDLNMETAGNGSRLSSTLVRVLVFSSAADAASLIMTVSIPVSIQGGGSESKGNACWLRLSTS